MTQAKFSSSSSAHITLPINLPNNPSPVMIQILWAILYCDNEVGEGRAIPSGDVKLFYKTAGGPSGTSYSEWGKIEAQKIATNPGNKAAFFFANSTADAQWSGQNDMIPNTEITLKSAGSFSGGNNSVDHYLKIAMKFYRGGTDFVNNDDLITVT